MNDNQPLGRYLLFRFDHYYPDGGANDLIGAYGSAEAAKAGLGRSPSFQGESAHVLDTATGRIVARNKGDKEWYGWEDTDEPAVSEP